MRVTPSAKARKGGAPDFDGAPEDFAGRGVELELEKKDAEIKRLGRELDQARMKSASSSVTSATEKIKDVGGVKVLAHRVDNLERAQMRTLVDQLRDKVGSGVVVLGSATDGTVSLIVGVTKDLTSKSSGGQSDRAGGAESWRAKAAGGLIWPKPAVKMPVPWMGRWRRLMGWYSGCWGRVA